MKINVSREEAEKHKPICCVYVITNDIEKKRYIGQTVNFWKRINAYKNIANKADCLQKGPISQSIRRYGHENFTVDILERCRPEELTELENKYIREYHTTDPFVGYNVVKDNSENTNNAESRRRKSESHKGLKESAATKRKKSNPIYATSISKGEDGKFHGIIIFVDSAKLFGDFVGKGKDMIKNCLRQPSKCAGYRVYYQDYEKRQEIRNKMLNKRSIRDPEYMEVLDLLDRYETEGVETMYNDFEVYDLSYNDLNPKNVTPILVRENPNETDFEEPEDTNPSPINDQEEEKEEKEFDYMRDVFKDDIFWY